VKQWKSAAESEEFLEAMTSFSEVGTTVLLVTLTLGLQCAGLGALIHWTRRAVDSGLSKPAPFRSALLVMKLSTAVIVLHGALILLWAGCYRWLCFPSWESAMYFSASSYATVGYGDAVLPVSWRMLGPVESIIGVLMCGISVSLVFALITRLVGRGPEPSSR
jgi:voltage-gated potassium channel